MADFFFLISITMGLLTDEIHRIVDAVCVDMDEAQRADIKTKITECALDPTPESTNAAAFAISRMPPEQAAMLDQQIKLLLRLTSDALGQLSM